MRPKWQIVAAIVGAAVLLGVGVGVALTVFSAPAPVKKTAAKRPEKKPVVKKQASAGQVCALDGREVAAGIVRPVAIMVENLNTIRPQAGPGQACLVVEGLSEAGITRFMLVFGAHDSDNVGPVRSARIAFTSLARGWDALYGHVGGSKYALTAIGQWGLFDWDQSAHGGDYTRVSSVGAPHNVFTGTKRLRDAAAGKETKTEPLSPFFKFKKSPNAKSLPEGAKSVIVDFSEPAYRVEWQYDRLTNTYKRFNGGQPHLDANTKAQLAPTNIVVVRAPHSAIVGGSGVLDVNMTAGGQAIVFRDGTVVEGTWERGSIESPLVIKNTDGKDIELTPGQTWVQVVEQTTPVQIQQ